MIATNIRKQARESLRGKWGKGVLIVLAYLLISLLISWVVKKFDENLFVLILETIVTIPLDVGIVTTFIRLKRDGEVGAFSFIEDAVTNFSRSWFLYLRMILKMILPIICIFAAMILYYIMWYISATQGIPAISVGTLILGIVIFVAAIAYATIIVLSYSLTIYIGYDNPNMSAKDVVNESARLMKGHRGDLFVLQLSFIGWAILSCFTLGIGFLWLLPYIQVSTVCFYEEVLKLKGTDEVEVVDNK